MLMEEFHRWIEEMDLNIENFTDFYKGCFLKKNSNILDLISLMAFEIYQLQVCVEGLIEDQEIKKVVRKDRKKKKVK